MLLRFFEGLGYGLVFLSIISLASIYSKREGEVLGGLFAAVFSGLAIGQGSAGIIWNFLLDISELSSIEVIKLISGVAGIITVVLLALMTFSRQKEDTSEIIGWKLPHFHLCIWLKKMLILPSLALLAIIFSLYDFAHGIYTPNLSIMLTEQGISAEVIDMRCLQPLDLTTLSGSIHKTNRCLIVEEDNLTAGWGAEVAARLGEEVFYYLDAPIKRIAAPDTPAPTAPILETEYLPSVETIVSTCLRLMDGG